MAGTAISSSVPQDDPPPEDVTLDEGAPPQDDDAGAADAAVEARAREMGWKPLAEYRGPPGKWQPAADFIARGENILPIVRDQNRRLTERMGKLEGEVTGLRSTAQEQLQIIKDLRDMGARANKAGYDRALAEIKQNQRAAVEAGDTKAYDQLVEQAEALSSARPATAAEPPKPATPAGPPPPSAALQAFFNENPWFNTDQFLNRKMIDAHIDVLQEGGFPDEAASLEEARRRIVEAYPDRFGGQRPAAPAPAAAPRQPARRAPAVAAPTPGDPGQRQQQLGGPMTAISQITDPTERGQARDAFNRMKRQLSDYTEKEYMALYDDPHGDVLTIQQKPRK
jgi:hypothetical protein